MKRRLLPTAAAFLLTAFFSVTSWSQEAQPAQSAPPSPSSGIEPQRSTDGSYTLHRSARLVVLDVVVTDRNDKVITGLPKSAFHVTELDQPQTLLDRQWSEFGGALRVPTFVAALAEVATGA